jgi:hypothetical protein
VKYLSSGLEGLHLLNEPGFMWRNSVTVVAYFFIFYLATFYRIIQSGILKVVEFHIDVWVCGRRSSVHCEPESHTKNE